MRRTLRKHTTSFENSFSFVWCDLSTRGLDKLQRYARLPVDKTDPADSGNTFKRKNLYERTEKEVQPPHRAVICSLDHRNVRNGPVSGRPATVARNLVCHPHSVVSGLAGALSVALPQGRTGATRRPFQDSRIMKGKKAAHVVAFFIESHKEEKVPDPFTFFMHASTICAFLSHLRTM